MPKITPKVCRCYCGLEFGTAEGLNAHMAAMRNLTHARPVPDRTPPMVVEGLRQPMVRTRSLPSLRDALDFGSSHG